MTFRAPKYSCTICNKTFRRNKQHYNHVMNAHNKNGKQGTNKKQIVVAIDLELAQMKPNQYFGRAYNFNAIPTGNRHLRTGIPLPRISSYRSAAI